jgi:hypothetical protein
MKSVVLLLVFALLSMFPVTAQSGNCDDPFAGVTPRFDTRYWESTDFCLHSVPYDEIHSGGPPPDGIPPIDQPLFETLQPAGQWLQPKSPVIMLEIGGKARAYPLAILIWHEVVNDVLMGEPVLVTYCPLCNSAIVFSREVNDEVLTFGVSGNLRNSDLIMWDRQTQSWWQQFSGEAIVGMYTGTRLEIIPSILTSFGDFSVRYPEGEVLSRQTGYTREYGTNPYVDYDSTSQPFLFEGEIDRRLPATEHVLAGVIDGEAVAYPFTILTQERVVNDTVGTTDVVVLWQWGAVSALDRMTIDESEEIGWAALYNRTIAASDGTVITLTFELSPDGYIRDHETASTWDTFGTATEGPLAGTQLELLAAAPRFWFAWAAFQPETRIYGVEG